MYLQKVRLLKKCAPYFITEAFNAVAPYNWMRFACMTPPHIVFLAKIGL